MAKKRMDVAAQAVNGYRAVQLQTQSTRSIEARLFAEITAALVRGRRAGKPGFRELATALHRNRALWDALLADISHDANALPTPLKAQLIRLGHFVREFTGRVLKGEAEVDALIDVNNAILEGLRATHHAGESDHARP
jgi:flagellar biosynthesis activator protein FlaF